MIRLRAHFPGHTFAVLFLPVTLFAAPTAGHAADLRPGLVGEYFDLSAVSGEFQELPAEAPVKLVRTDRQVNFESTNGEFNRSKLSERFFVRWTGILRIPKDGNYGLWLNSDDGSRLHLNNERVIDNWGLHGMTRRDVRRGLRAGDYHIRIEFFDQSADAGCIFGWDLPDGGKSEPVPAANLFHDRSSLANAQSRKAFAEKRDSMPKATVNFIDTDQPRRFGFLLVEGDKLAVAQSSGEKIPIDPAEVARIEFNSPEWDRGVDEEQSKPPPAGPLAAPWKHATVGRLVSGSSAHGKDGRYELFTSARRPDEKFSAFTMAYRPAPAVGHITARVSRIENTSWDSIAGLIVRDGTGPDDRNVMLTVRASGGASMRSWKSQGGSTRSDGRGDLRPPYWLRIVRDGEHITGLTSPDGRAWRKLWDVSVPFAGKNLLFGLVVSGREGNSPWGATFENVSVGTLEEADAAAKSEPRIYLTDGSVLRGVVISSESGNLIHLGEPWNRTIPALYVSRIDFFHPMSDEVEERLSRMRPGVLLTVGDFLEAKFERLEPESLTVTSALFGKKELRPGSEADSAILREVDPDRIHRSAFRVETWDDQVFAARGFTISGGKFVFDAPVLGEPVFSPDKIRRIAPPEPEAP